MSAGSTALSATPPPPPPPLITDGTTLLDLLLLEQQTLTAVDRFSSVHEAAPPTQAKYYKRLLPAAPPLPGEQYSFEVDLDACSGCKACVAACHSLNGLDDDETWREVGLLHGGSGDQPFMQHVTTACHHCVEPACLHGCPVDAYHKDPVTGIVKHLDDQCIGCRYCTLACPYEVPKYNPARGIVRKCDMCSNRLAVGEAPACVQACPHEAIRIRTVSIEDVVRDCNGNQFLPTAPNPDYTLPTTNYKSSRPLPRNLQPGDFFSLHAEHGHPPLVAMLVLSQMSVGGFVLLLIAETTRLFPQGPPLPWMVVLTALTYAVGHASLGAATLHLGRPLYAFRALLGLRRSWLSREIFAFTVYIALGGLVATDVALTWLNWTWRPPFVAWALPATVLWGLIGVFCSMMIYHSTRKPTWNAAHALPKFLLTTLVLGTGLAGFAAAAVPAFFPAPQAAAALDGLRVVLPRLGIGWATFAALKLIWDVLPLAALTQRHESHWKRSARLLVGDLRRETFARFSLGIVCGIFLPLHLLVGSADAVLHPGGIWWVASVGLALLGTVLGEAFERAWYFTAAVAPRMPGGVKT